MSDPMEVVIVGGVAAIDECRACGRQSPSTYKS